MRIKGLHLLLLALGIILTHSVFPHHHHHGEDDHEQTEHHEQSTDHQHSSFTYGHLDQSFINSKNTITTSISADICFGKLWHFSEPPIVAEKESSDPSDTLVPFKERFLHVLFRGPPAL